jgi:hypothetical protein
MMINVRNQGQENEEGRGKGKVFRNVTLFLLLLFVKYYSNLTFFPFVCQSEDKKMSKERG